MLRIGTSGFSYPGPPPKGWCGAFYPERRGRGFNELSYYSRFFDAVEINSSFYRPSAASVAAGWVGRTPEHFEFTVKVWQKFTHAKKIGEGVSWRDDRWEETKQGDVDLFLKGIEPLSASGKLGALLFQYPAGFHCSAENVEKLQRTLEVFRSYPKVVELRHRSWSDERIATRGLLAEQKTSWALIDEPKFGSSVRQDFGPVGEVLYFRAHGRNAANWWNHAEPWMRYDYCYSEKEIHEFAGKLKKVMEERKDLSKGYAFFNNHARGQAVVNAMMLRNEMGTPVKAVPSEELLKVFPQLSGIVPAPPQRSLF